MKTLIMTDDNSGIKHIDLSKFGLKMMRMPILINGEVYFQDENIDFDKFYELQENNADIRTSQPAIGEIIEAWDEALKEYDEILYIPMSSGLSESCNSAKNLSLNYKDKVFVVDNHRISVTLKSSVYDALNLVKQGKTAKEIKQILESEASNSSIFIMVDTLKYLKKGGRITPAGALLGEALHIKPVLQINGGKLDAYKKCIGSKKAKKVMLEAIKHDLETKFDTHDINDFRVAIAYTKDFESAKIFMKEACEYLHINPNNVEIDQLSLSVATHIGPGSLAITISKKVR